VPRIHIDNQPVDVPQGATILDAARSLGIDIPALCFLTGWEANTSCMACVVKVEGRGGLVPSCATVAVEGMRVESESDEVRSVRRTALELLLSDHLGDCMAPCHSVCPARMNIPLMIRQIAAGQMREAIATVKADIALPAVLGRICPAPCEKACRRGEKDAAISIFLLKRHAADVDLAGGEPYMPVPQAASGKRVAVVGAGPTGLAAAYYLLAHGHAVTIFDDRPAPGGMLRYGVEESRLPHAVLDAEIDLVRRMGAELRSAVHVGRDVPMADLRRDFAAVFVAAGKVDPPAVAELGLEADPAGGARADRHTYATGTPGVFAACTGRQQKLAVRAVAAGKAAAESIHQFLCAQAVAGQKRPFTVHVGKLQDGEIERFMEGVAERGRIEPADAAAGLSHDEAAADCERCLHCDCRRPDDCKLRRYADAYGASASAYKAGRRTFEQVRQHAEVIFEPGKCIDCGLCIQVAQRAGEKFGLAFVRRGFNVRLIVPLGRTLAEGLAKAGADCVAACPTGALAMRK
jgi:ferredoxin